MKWSSPLTFYAKLSLWMRFRIRLLNHHPISISDIVLKFFKRLTLTEHTGNFFQLADIPIVIQPILKGKMSLHRMSLIQAKRLHANLSVPL